MIEQRFVTIIARLFAEPCYQQASLINLQSPVGEILLFRLEYLILLNFDYIV